MDTRVK